MQVDAGTILLVDDEIADRDQMRSTLEREGYTVLEAGNYRSALHVFRTCGQPIDLLLTDISLPGDNGCELAKALLREQPGLRLMFISGHTGAEIFKFYGIPYADRHFLRKPFRPEELAQRVREVMHSADSLPGFGAHDLSCKEDGPRHK